MILVLFWDHSGVIMASSWDHFGVILASFWDHFGVMLASSWDHFGVTMASSGDQFGVIWESICHRSGTNDFHQNVAEQILAPESRSRAISRGKMTRISTSIRSTGLRLQVGGWRQWAKPLRYLTACGIRQVLYTIGWEGALALQCAPQPCNHRQGVGNHANIQLHNTSAMVIIT